MTIRIISCSNELFQDRQEAGRLLASELTQFSSDKTVVIGIPRGGVIVAYEIARGLKAEFDIVLAHKLCSPGHAELAIGSVTEHGKTFLNKVLVRGLSVSDDYIEEEKRRQLVAIKSRANSIRRVKPKVPLTGKTVILTDDGVATGATVQAAIWSVKLENPARLIVALPVGPKETITNLSVDVDEVICLRTPEDFAAVGQFYLRYTPVDDNAVLKIMGQESR